MKTDKYTSKMNGTNAFVKDYSASFGMHVETLNASSPCSGPHTTGTLVP